MLEHLVHLCDDPFEAQFRMCPRAGAVIEGAHNDGACRDGVGREGSKVDVGWGEVVLGIDILTCELDAEMKPIRLSWVTRPRRSDPLSLGDRLSCAYVDPGQTGISGSEAPLVTN